MTVTLGRRADIDVAAFARVAWQGEEVAIAPPALEVVARRRAEFLALVASDPARKLYGVNVHAGDGSDRLMTEAEQRDYARGLHSATSFGEPFPRRVVRGFVLARLANLIEGHAGVSPELVTTVAARLDGRALPPVPRLGNGGPGEILALGWLFADVPGELALGVKESMALINGAPCAAALLADATLCTERALALAVDVFCLAVAAFGVAPTIYHERLEELWGDPGQAAALRAIRAGIAGAEPPPSAAAAHPQPPVSFRILPRVLGNANRLLAAAREAAEIALPAVSDNPVFLFGSADGDLGDIVSTGGFHNGAVPAAIDGLAFALADLAQLAHHQLQRLQTSPEAMPGLDSLALGTMQMVSAGYAEETRSAVVPSLLPLPGFGHNDAPSPSFHAYNRFDRVHGFVVGSLTCLAAMAAQSFARTGRAAPPALSAFMAEVLELCPPVVERRSVGAELGRLAQRLGGGVPE
ncbi:MAG: aromatic amino acid lyase [Solirubrobacteraceae bacterium]